MGDLLIYALSRKDSLTPEARDFFSVCLRPTVGVSRCAVNINRETTWMMEPPTRSRTGAIYDQNNYGWHSFWLATV
jgi:hypothetical protein